MKTPARLTLALLLSFQSVVLASPSALVPGATLPRQKFIEAEHHLKVLPVAKLLEDFEGPYKVSNLLAKINSRFYENGAYRGIHQNFALEISRHLVASILLAKQGYAGAARQQARSFEWEAITWGDHVARLNGGDIEFATDALGDITEITISETLHALGFIKSTEVELVRSELDALTKRLSAETGNGLRKHRGSLAAGPNQGAAVLFVLGGFLAGLGSFIAGFHYLIMEVPGLSFLEFIARLGGSVGGAAAAGFGTGFALSRPFYYRAYFKSLVPDYKRLSERCENLLKDLQ